MGVRKLIKEEKEVLDAFNSDEYRSDLSDERKKTLGKIARETFKKDKRINIRISGRDLDALQRRALREGVPYQTLVSSILHKYVSGELINSDTVNSMRHEEKKPGNRKTVRKSRG